MKRLRLQYAALLPAVRLATLFLALSFSHVHARQAAIQAPTEQLPEDGKNVNRKYVNVSLSEALLQLQSEHSDYAINFLYNELEDFRITTTVKNKKLPDAIQQMIGFYPVRMTVKPEDREIYVECTHKTDRHLTGTIVDEQGQPVTYANVAIFNPADSTLLGGGVSNESGYFAVPYERLRTADRTSRINEEILVRISYVGYKTLWLLCNQSALGTIQMQPETMSLKGVTVKGMTPVLRREAGVIIFDTRHVVGAVSATDLLRYAPGLMIEDDNISLFGTSGVIFQIDGREQRLGSKEMLQMLKSFPASDVERIEIIQSPGASYSAEGNAGIINIVLKKKASDFIGGSAGYARRQDEERLRVGDRSSEVHGDEANAGIIYNRGKISTSLNLTGTRDDTRYLETNSIRFTDNLRHGTDNGRISKDNYALRWQADYHVSDELNLGTYAMYADGERRLAIDGLYNFHPKVLRTLNTIDTQTRRQEDTKTLAVNVNAAFKSRKTGIKADCNFDYYRMRMDDSRRSVSNETMIGNSLAEIIETDSTDFDYKNSIDHHVDNYSVKLDVGYAGFQLGGQYAYTCSHRDLDYSGSSVSYDKVSTAYDERVLSGYLEYGTTFSNWSVNVGGRYEHTWTKGDNQPMEKFRNHTDYGKLFPSLRIGYSPSQSHVFNCSLSNRITRPNIINLNPDKVWRDVNHTSFGNQNLKPSYLYKAMMGYTFKGVLSLDFCYVYEHDRVDAVYSIDKQVTNNSWDNITDEHSLGVNSFFCFDRLRWMSFTLTQGIWYSKTIRPDEKNAPKVLRRYMYPEVESFSYSGMLQTTFFFDRDRKWTASLNATYSSPEKDVAKSLNARYMVDVGLQYRFWKDRLTLGLTCRNLLASHVKGTEYLGTTTMDFDNKYNYRQFRFSLTCNWGARLRHHQRHYESDEMQERIVNDF